MCERSNNTKRWWRRERLTCCSYDCQSRQEEWCERQWKIKREREVKGKKQLREERVKWRDQEKDEKWWSSGFFFFCALASHSLTILVTFLTSSPILSFTKTESRTSFFGFFVGHVFNRYKTRVMLTFSLPLTLFYDLFKDRQKMSERKKRKEWKSQESLLPAQSQRWEESLFARTLSERIKTKKHIMVWRKDEGKKVSK